MSTRRSSFLVLVPWWLCPFPFRFTLFALHRSLFSLCTVHGSLLPDRRCLFTTDRSPATGHGCRCPVYGSLCTGSWWLFTAHCWRLVPSQALAATSSAQAAYGPSPGPSVLPLCWCPTWMAPWWTPRLKANQHRGGSPSIGRLGRRWWALYWCTTLAGERGRGSWVVALDEIQWNGRLKVWRERQNCEGQ